MPKARTKPILNKPANEPISNPRSRRKVTMNSTTATVKTRFAKRLRVPSWVAGCETEEPMLSNRKPINAAASIASGSPNLFVGSPTGADVRALICRINEM